MILIRDIGVVFNGSMSDSKPEGLGSNPSTFAREGWGGLG